MRDEIQTKLPALPENRISAELRAKFKTANNTLSRDVKDNPKDKIELEIGDSKQPDFKPQAKIMRWSNEVNFSIRAEEHSEAQVRTEGKLIKYITPEYEVHQYELDPGDIGEDGGLEFEWVLPKKPASNVLRATIQTKELDFFYQPPLTQEEIEQGAERPENVVGSYAVYHKTKGGMNRADGMEYKTGKAFHIYRPKVKDAEGNEIWGELNIDEGNGLLTVTIDQTWLDNAVYPVVVDPTFGYTSGGGSTASAGSNDAEICKYTLSENGDVTSISMYGRSSSGTVNAKGLIYDDDGTSAEPGTRLAVSAVASFNTTANFRTASASVSLTAGDFYIGGVSGGNFVRFYYDSGSNKARFLDNVASYSDPVDPWSEGSDSHFTEIDSFYATYTASGGSSVKKLSGIAQASLKKISSIAIASVKKVSGVANS